MSGREQGRRPHIGDDGPNLLSAQIAEKLSLRSVQRKLAAGGLPVILHADSDGGQRSQVDVLDIRKWCLTHCSSLA